MSTYPKTGITTSHEKKNNDFKLIKSTDSHCDAGLEHARAVVCSKIIQIMDSKKLSTRDTERLTAISHTEFSRIRNAKLKRFTLDRLIIILGKLDPQIEINISFDTRPVVNSEPKAIEGIYEAADERVYLKNLAGNDVSIFCIVLNCSLMALTLC